MAEPSDSVRDFITNAYQLVSASSPTVPLQGSDLSFGIQLMNQLMQHYSSTANLLTVAQRVDYALAIGQQYITFGDSSYTPAPDVTIGRLANIQNAWITLNNVVYPLIEENRNDFQDSYYFDPLLGLPRFVILYPETNLTSLRVFPAPSQVYAFSVYGKFQLNLFNSNTDLSTLPNYETRFLQLAVARDIAIYRGRASAWTEMLEKMYIEAKQDMESTTSYSLQINLNKDCWLNGAYRVQAGV